MTDPGEIGDDIYPERPEHAVPEPRPLETFLPWHLPRKQWVRRKQWAAATADLIGSLNPVGRPITYFGLPGTELLDIEVLAETCGREGLVLRYLGLNRAKQTAVENTLQNLAQSDVLTIDNIHAQSGVYPDDVLDLRSKTSMAAMRLRDFESFDVVNLDLCDVLTTTAEKAVHEAIKNLLEFQCDGRTQPWLLFVTTALQRPDISPADLGICREALTRNAQVHEGVCAELASICAVDAPRVRDGMGPLFDRADGVKFGKLWAVAFGKWLATVLRRPHPWKVELKSCVYYRGGINGLREKPGAVPTPELFSLVFGLKRSRVRLVDPARARPGEVAAEAEQEWHALEGSSAAQVARRIARRAFDLDVAMEQDAAMRERLLEETAGMLRRRNYDDVKYRDWARAVPRVGA